MKHRGSSKIKYEHEMIHGLREFLEEKIEPLDYVENLYSLGKTPLSGSKNNR